MWFLLHRDHSRLSETQQRGSPSGTALRERSVGGWQLPRSLSWKEVSLQEQGAGGLQEHQVLRWGPPGDICFPSCRQDRASLTPQVPDL